MILAASEAAWRSVCRSCLRLGSRARHGHRRKGASSPCVQLRAWSTSAVQSASCNASPRRPTPTLRRRHASRLRPTAVKESVSSSARSTGLATKRWSGPSGPSTGPSGCRTMTVRACERGALLGSLGRPCSGAALAQSCAGPAVAPCSPRRFPASPQSERLPVRLPAAAARSLLGAPGAAAGAGEEALRVPQAQAQGHQAGAAWARGVRRVFRTLRGQRAGGRGGEQHGSCGTPPPCGPLALPARCCWPDMRHSPCRPHGPLHGPRRRCICTGRTTSSGTAARSRRCGRGREGGGGAPKSARSRRRRSEQDAAQSKQHARSAGFRWPHAPHEQVKPRTMQLTVAYADDDEYEEVDAAELVREGHIAVRECARPVSPGRRDPGPALTAPRGLMHARAQWRSASTARRSSAGTCRWTPRTRPPPSTWTRTGAPLALRVALASPSPPPPHTCRHRQRSQRG